MKNDTPNYGSGSNPWSAMTVPMEQWMGLMRAWTEMWAGFLPGSSAGPWQNPWLQQWGMGTTGAQPQQAAQRASAQSIALKVRVSSAVAAEVNACLLDGSDCMALTVDVPSLRGVTIGYESGGVVLVVNVEASQAPGEYRGTVKDGSRIVGNVLVRILARPAAE